MASPCMWNTPTLLAALDPERTDIYIKVLL